MPPTDPDYVPAHGSDSRVHHLLRQRRHDPTLDVQIDNVYDVAPLLADPLLTVTQLARLLNVTRGWIYDEVEAGALPCVRVGRNLRFVPSEVNAYLQARRDAGRPAGRPRTR